MADANIIDLMGGPGGWDTGLAMCGRTDVLGVEWDTAACDTARAAGHQRLQADVAELEPSAFGPVEGLIGSPPCQGFSKAGSGKGREDSSLIIAAVDDFASGLDPRDSLRSKVKDDRSVLALEPLRWALALEPEWMTWEQVPAVLPLWEACAVALRSAGYSVWTGNLQAEQYGVPQTRKRAILTATRTGVAQQPTPTHSRYHTRTPDRLDDGMPRWVSMAEAIGWGMTQRPYPAVATGTAAGGTDPQAIGGSGARRGIRIEREAGRWVEKQHDDSPDQWGRPFTPVTVPTLLETGHQRRIGDSPNDGVRLSVAEAGVLQSFPGTYPWQGGKSAQYRQVGDAVPPLLAAHILASVGAVSLQENAA